MYLILFVLHNTEKIDSILDAWDNVGVTGVTILYSAGLAHVRSRRALSEDLPIIPRLDDFLHTLANNRTLFTIVEDEALVDKVIAATEKITGDLNQPDTGVLAVLPVTRAHGLNRVESGNENSGR